MSGVAAAPWLQFICEVCGLIYDEARGDPDSGLPPGTRFADIPEDWACPICGVGKADFVLRVPATAAAPTLHRPAAGLQRRRDRGHRGDRGDGVLIVGGGRAGWQVAQALRELGADLPITLLSACSADVYDKPQLSVAVARGLAIDGLVRETAHDAALRLDVRLLPRTAAVHVDVAMRRLRTARGPLHWQHLVLAHGAEPALPAVLPPALVWRINDLAAYTRLRAVLARGPQRLVIVGAGLVGCELANDLALAGHSITLLDLQDRPLPAALPAQASARLLAAWADAPIRFVGGVRVTAVARGPAGVLQLQTADTGIFEADQIIAATGLRTAGRLARSAGLAWDESAGGIVTDGATGATSQPGIYALGDCAVVAGQASRYIEPIARQARAIAAAIAGMPVGAVDREPRPLPAPVLRVKTTALPITVTGPLGRPGDGSRWQVEADDASELRMQRLDRDGHVLATLTAQRQRPPAAVRHP